mmetsp:Transcript_28098/g.74152  ORF Transcript_28098/g.74152 Transcript_28098/m.74152 type:complete len:244 (+) Transcript_28098:1029-1760(+)
MLQLPWELRCEALVTMGDPEQSCKSWRSVRHGCSLWSELVSSAPPFLTVSISGQAKWCPTRRFPRLPGSGTEKWSIQSRLQPWKIWRILWFLPPTVSLQISIVEMFRWARMATLGWWSGRLPLRRLEKKPTSWPPTCRPIATTPTSVPCTREDPAREWHPARWQRACRCWLRLWATMWRTRNALASTCRPRCWKVHGEASRPHILPGSGSPRCSIPAPTRASAMPAAMAASALLLRSPPLHPT